MLCSLSEDALRKKKEERRKKKEERRKKKEERRTRRPKQVSFHNPTHRNFLLFACVETLKPTMPNVPPHASHICVRPPAAIVDVKGKKYPRTPGGYLQKTGLWVGARRFSSWGCPLTFPSRSGSWKQESRDSQLLLAW